LVAGAKNREKCRDLSSCVERGGLGDERPALDGSAEAFHARHAPFLDPRRFLRAAEDGQGGAKLDDGGDGVAGEQVAQARESEGIEFAHLVEEAFVAAAETVAPRARARVALVWSIERALAAAGLVETGGAARADIEAPPLSCCTEVCGPEAGTAGK